MAYSVHVPLWFGMLKIKSARVLRHEERYAGAPVWRVGNMCFVWSRRRRNSAN